MLHKRPLRVNAIGAKVGLTPGSISVAVDRLNASGLVSRIEDCDGRPIRIVDLTPAGRSLIEPVFFRHAAFMEKIVAVLTPQERVQWESLLKKSDRHAETIHVGKGSAASRDR